MNLLLVENIDTNVGRDLRKVFGTSSDYEALRWAASTQKSGMMGAESTVSINKT